MTVMLAASALVAQQKRQRVIFFGDSITELGIRDGGYVTRLNTLIGGAGRSDQFELIGAGVSGNKIYDLYLRMDQDVVEKKPDIVVLYIGVNDVWHKRSMGTGTDYGKFGKFYDAVVSKLEKNGAKVIVCTPAVIGERTDSSNELDGDLNLYSRWIREFSTKRSLPLVDLRKAFLDFNLVNNKENKDQGILTNDKVHLNAAGNALVAEEIWKALQKF
ncbi:MAG: SGNH/GDSL hydrolase family protein [Acidobacteriota bacterium]|jgi:lysophospholipase L1-like esterase